MGNNACYAFYLLVGGSPLSRVSVVTCLRVQFDNQHTFIPHVLYLARRCFYHLRQLRSVRRTLTTDSAKALVHALIASRLDYCNSVLYQINTTATKTLQSVLHSAARLVMRKLKRMTLRDGVASSRELSISSARSSSSVSIKPHRNTSRSFVLQLQQAPVAATCTLPLVAICKFLRVDCHL